MGMMIPSDKRRKSVSAINELLGAEHQSSLNRFLHGSAGKLLRSIRDNDLAGRLKDRGLALVLDDALVEHPYAEKMEGVSSFYDITKKQEVQGHRLVTAALVEYGNKRGASHRRSPLSKGRVLSRLDASAGDAETFLIGPRNLE